MIDEQASKRRLPSPPGPLGRVAVALGVAAIACAAHADVVILKNGDRLTGKVVHKMADELTFSTDYAGTLKLRWSDVAALTTAKPVSLMTGEEHVVAGTLGAGTSAGRAQFVPRPPPGAPKDQPPAPRDIALADVRFLNPTIEESGTGVLWTGHVNVGGASTSGNSTNGTLHAEVDATGRARHYRVLAGGEYNHATSNDVESASNWRARGEYDRFYRNKDFSYVRATFEHDPFKALELRSTAGAGLGYQFFESPALNLSAQAGLDYVVVDNIGVPDQDYAAPAWVIRYDQKPFGLNMQFFHQQDGTVSLDSHNTVVLHTQTGVRAPIGLGINATLQYNYDWTNDPPAGRFSADRTLLFTLGYAW
jgi:putative salt-induced outer membrane protein YdiY